MADISEGDRQITIQGGSYQSTQTFAGNTVKTSKYTLGNFLPKNLYEQLHKFGNAYFLCISVIMYLGEKTPLFVGTIKAFSTLGLLVIMMSITAAMALLDDIRRKEADEEINNSKARVLKPNREVVDSKWGEVKVGDVLLVKENEEFPADVVPLYCSGEGGHCYVSTANLDGETNLKLKAASPASQKLLERNLAAKIPDTKVVESIKMTAESPSANIHDFNGNIAVLNLGKRLEESLGAKQLLMRGTVLRNTAISVGVVVYTGADTRMVRNSRPSPLKQSNLERVTNVAMGLILVSQALLALVSDLCHFVNEDSFTEYWYLKPPSIVLPGLIGYWLTFFTLYSNLMPISLYPTAEFCNAFQSYCIKNDKKMFYKEEGFNDGVGFSAKARSSNLCQELGQVQYIFSDKTGTLTQNVMELKRLSIAGRQYGEMTAAKGFTGTGDLQTSRRNNDRDMIDGFLEAFAVSHTVMASKNADGSLKYEAESPDEFALVKAAADLGWRFTERQGDTMTCEYRSPGNEIKPRTYTVLATNEFDSARKRMSVIVKRDDDQYLLLVKGADNVMMERAARKETILNQHLKEFSQQGLRTLVIARRKLDPIEVDTWKAKYDQAQRETKDRGIKLANVAEEIENNLEILGATAIEDKLQDKVPEAIENIRRAGIKLWVLTGDKLETARNIGFSTKVLNSEMEILTLDPEEGDTDLHAGDRRLQAKSFENRGIMVTGKMLTGLLNDPEKKEQFTVLADKCSVLIACRVSPLQKAEMVRLVRERPQKGMTKSAPVTLAIGDGANDVPMIQEAQVGVGIAGREGRQAVNNSDFAIAQFQYLQRLLFVHGRWNYRRACKFTLFTFWRNTVQVLMSFYFSFVSGYSGTNLFEDWVRLSFNVICSLPILAVGCFDKDVSDEMALRKPELYEVGRRGKDLGLKKVTYTLAAAVLHSATLFCVTLFSFPSLDLSNSGDYYTFGTAVYTCLIIDVTYRAFFVTDSHNKYTRSSLFVALFGYAIYLVVYTESKFITNVLEPNMFHVGRRMAKSGYFWICVFTVPLIAMVLDIFITFLYHRFFPDKKEQVEREEQQSKTKSEASTSLLGEYSEQSKEENDTQWSELLSPEDAKLISQSDEAQQTVPARRMYLTRSSRVKTISIITGLIFMIIGGVCWVASRNTKQVRVTYFDATKLSGAHQYTSSWAFGSAPMWSTEEEKVSVPDSSCKSLGAEVRPRKCTHTFQVPKTMTPPILIYYALGPYYQNFNDYLKSEVSKELMGEEVPASLREAKCPWDRTRVTASGEDIIPCGMKATSLFNDSFELHGFHISKEKLAWTSDVNRYHNLKNYPDKKGTSWLYERYSETVTKEEGVKNEAFNVWMRPSSMPRIWNPYGLVSKKEGIPAGNLTITIDDRYTPPKGTYKTVVITEFNQIFGARHSGFGALIAISGILCWVIACATSLADLIPETTFKGCDEYFDQCFE